MFFVRASKYPNEAPQRPETCGGQLFTPSRMKKGTKIDTANLVIILDMKPLCHVEVTCTLLIFAFDFQFDP